MIEGNTRIVELLIENGANVNAKDVFEDTAMHEACIGGHASVVKLLLNHGASPDVRGFGGTPLDIAEKNGFTTIVEMLKSHSKTEEETPNT